VHAQGRYSFEFVPGIEVTTRSGHLLALWVDSPVRSFRPLNETVATIHRLGGVAVIPHPLSYLTRSIGERTLDRLLGEGNAETRPDAIEVANTTLAGRVTGARALRANRARWGLAETGGSDAHFLEEVGAARTLFPGRTAGDLRTALAEGRTAGVSRGAVPLRTIGARRLALQQIRGLSTTPRKVIGPPVARMVQRARGQRATAEART
jgi:predicted metal-dependent phosphoesterase TrpH